MSRAKTIALVGVYLAAIVAANQITATYGPEASIYNAFFLIGLDLTTRDALHDAWGRNRWRNMALLVLAGSLLSYAVNADAAKVAEASAIAFGAAATADALVYQAMRRSPWLERANGSNVVGAAVDSLIFPTIAFGGVMWSITFAQFSAKIAGGFIFALLLSHTLQRTAIRHGDVVLHGDEAALALVASGQLEAHQAPMAVLRDQMRREAQ